MQNNKMQINETVTLRRRSGQWPAVGSRLAAGLLAPCLLVLGLLPGPAPAQSGADVLRAGFANPPASARPRTWWHWTGGNITLDGISRDLEWMERVGIAGFQLADVSAGSGQSVEPKIEFGTPEWYDAVRHAAAEADRLDLEMALFSSPGWSETGGPWVTPEQGMQRMVWTETRVTGPARFDDVLPQAPANLETYADSVVLAFPVPAAEADNNADLAVRAPRVRSSGGEIDVPALFDGNLRSGSSVATPGDGEPAWVELEFDTPFTARALTIAGAGGGRNGVPVGRVLVGDDTAALTTLVGLPGAQLYRQGSVRTFAFPATTARIWRIEMTGAPLDPALTMSQEPPRSFFRCGSNNSVHGFLRRSKTSTAIVAPMLPRVIPLPEQPVITNWRSVVSPMNGSPSLVAMT
jgi:hypothetical protein